MKIQMQMDGRPDLKSNTKACGLVASSTAGVIADSCAFHSDSFTQSITE